jgi:S1-C subfamily serine protease
MDNALVALSNELAATVERAGKHVVSVHGHPRISSSGILWKPGVIVTSEHMLRRDDDVRVTLPDGSQVTATIAGRDAGTDLAVLKVESESSNVDTEAALQAGNLVLAVGRSRDSGVSAALGVISNIADAWNTWRGGRVDRLIRLDLRLYPGSSGAAVVNAAGKLIGMATSALSRTSPVTIPVSTIERITKELLEKGHVARGYLGVGLQPVGLPEHLRTKHKLAEASGLIVLSVEQEAPAGKAGLVIGDILVALDGKPVDDTGDVQAVLGPEFLGKTLRASVVRGGELREVSIVVGERPRRRA